MKLFLHPQNKKSNANLFRSVVWINIQASNREGVFYDFLNINNFLNCVA